MGMSLDTNRKAALIVEVDALVERVRQQADSAEEARKVLDMTNFALNYLRRCTPDALRALLEVPHATTTVQKYWWNFGAHLRPTLDRLNNVYPEPAERWEALLYVLGWLHRVSHGQVGEYMPSPQPRLNRETPISALDQTKKDIGYRPANRPRSGGEFSSKLGSLLNPPATSPSAPGTSYRQGDRVQVTVITAGVNGVARLPDGAEIRGVNLYGVKEGAIITVRVIEVTGAGRIKRVGR
jgi:hypothetical protein